ncbi:hypothetical protein [Streptomyces sp. NPDC059943]|uniref:hypothetical protein n=1 Tax=Streptomyces sp. NPDC059943 TaxID=3347010 RepID=UPI0036687395
MNHTRVRTILVAAPAAALLALAGACGDTEQGSAERAVGIEEPAADTEAEPVEEEPAEDEQPATELAVGDGFLYDDGVKFTVTKIEEVGTDQYGEYDDKPAAGETGFRVHWDIANGSKKPHDLDMWGISAQGATTGGETTYLTVEHGTRAMAGRLAPGRTGSYTGEYLLPKSDGREIVFTATRMDDEADVLAEDPNWTGTIK